MADRLYRVQAGRLSTLTLIPGEPVELADVDFDRLTEPARYHAIALAGQPEHSGFVAEVLPVLLEAAERMVPWVRWYAAPGFTDASGREVNWGGNCRTNTGCIMVCTRWGLKWSLDIIHHEIWHCLEEQLTAAEHEVLYAAVQDGPHYLDRAYHGSATERQARAFAAWCVARLECPGSPPATGWRAWARRASLAPHERIWEAAWSGALAKRAMARGWVPQRLSAAARKARDAARAALGPVGLRTHPKGIAAA